MKLSTLALAASFCLALSACSKPEATSTAPAAPATATAPAPSSPYDLVASTGKGFTVGAMMSAQTVYVLFDPQCPHCGHLWQASVPLHSKVRFVWIPIAFNTGKSLAQAAALLSAANPAEAMTAHEASLLAGTGGMSASADIASELKRTVENNTQLLNNLGVDSVPFLIGKHKTTGEIVRHNGSMDTAALSNLLGV